MTMAKAVWLTIFYSGAFFEIVSTTPSATAADNTAVKVGTPDVTFTCTFATDEAVQRKWYKTAVATDNLFPDGDNVAAIKDSITISPNPASGTTSELKISVAATAHADKYFCQTADAAGANPDSKSAYIEVLTPKCNISSDGGPPEKLDFSCGTTYAGDWKPELSFGATADDENSEDGTKEVTLTGKKAVSDVTAGTTWNCKATMRKSNFQNSVSVDSATDNVEVTNICSWEMAAPTQEPTVSAFGSSPTESDKITCSGSDGVPPPTYSWKKGSTAIADNGNLTLTADHSGQTLTCVARNPYGEQTKEVEVPTLATTTTVAATEAPVTAGNRKIECLLALTFFYTIFSKIV